MELVGDDAPLPLLSCERQCVLYPIRESLCISIEVLVDYSSAYAIALRDAGA